MGLLIAKFRKSKTNEDVLEKLDKEIKGIEDYRRNTEQKHKKIVGQFLVLSIGVYIVAALLLYFYYPNNLRKRISCLIPLIIAPVLIVSLKKLLTWYYNKKIAKNQQRLVDLKSEKKKILENVMETETYKVARTILEKYAPEQVRRVNLSSNNEITPIKPSTSLVPQTTGLRNRFPPKPPIKFGLVQTPSRQNIAGLQNVGISATPSATGQVAPMPFVPGTPLPRAVLPKDRSILDKMVEYLVGDGPSNRYALICKKCFMHNGMALKEEFEYFAFHCCYCCTFNPARKKRPAAPKLNFDSSPPVASNSDTSDSEKHSGTDSDDASSLPPSETERKELLSLDVLYKKEDPGRTSDNEATSDFDKLSDLDLKDPEQPMEIDGSVDKTRVREPSN